MYGDGKSDRPIVPQKLTNNGGHGEAWPHPVQPLAEPVEGRGWAEGNSRQDAGSRTLRRANPQDSMARIRQAAEASGRHDLRQEPGAVVPHAGICPGGAPQGAFLPESCAHLSGGVNCYRQDTEH